MKGHNGGLGTVTERLGVGIQSCELALSSASANAWEDNIRSARKAHHTALRFVHRFKVSGQEAHRLNQRITHLKALLDELR